MTINDLRKTLQNNTVQNLYLIDGNEKYLVDMAIGEFTKNDVLVSLPELNYSRIKDPIDFLDFERVCRSFPFMSERRLVIIDIDSFVQQDIEKVISLIQVLPDYLVLVFVAFSVNSADKKNSNNSNKNDNKHVKNNTSSLLLKWLSKNTKDDQLINCSTVKNNNGVIDYLCGLVAKNNMYISRSDSEFLCSYCSADFSTLINELKKLIAVCEKCINRNDIITYCIKSDEYKVYMLHEYFVWHEYEKSMELYKSILSENGKPMWLIGMLCKNVDLLIQVKLCAEAGYDNNKIINTIEKNTLSAGWKIKKAIHESESYQLGQLLDMIHGLSLLDFGLKHGEVYGDMDLYGFLVNMYEQKKRRL